MMSVVCYDKMSNMARTAYFFFIQVKIIGREWKRKDKRIDIEKKNGRTEGERVDIELERGKKRRE